MKILFLTQILPYPLDAGPKIRAYYVLRHLAQHHDVTLISFVRPTDTDSSIAHLSEFCTAVHTLLMPRSKLRDGVHLLRSLLTGQPFIIARDWMPQMANLLKQIMRNDTTFDAIHADQLWMAPYALWAQEVAPNECNPMTVLDQHNAVYMIPERLAEGEKNPLKRLLLGLEAHKMARHEVDLCRHFDHATWVTQEDYDAVQQETEQIIPNSGIIPICGDPEGKPPITRKANGRRVTFLGGLHYPPNAQGICWFAEHVFPHVLAQIPDAILTVIGKQPPAKLHTYGIPDANLEVTGFVIDPMDYLAETAAFVVPLHAGGGMRVKILDAWTWGLPMVSTTIGAEGIKTEPDKNILIADTPENFAHATIQMLQQPDWAQQIADAGRQWVEAQYNWRITYQQWDKIYSSHTEAVA